MLTWGLAAFCFRAKREICHVTQSQLRKWFVFVIFVGFNLFYIFRFRVEKTSERTLVRLTRWLTEHSANSWKLAEPSWFAVFENIYEWTLCTFSFIVAKTYKGERIFFLIYLFFILMSKRHYRRKNYWHSRFVPNSFKKKQEETRQARGIIIASGVGSLHLETFHKKHLLERNSVAKWTWAPPGRRTPWFWACPRRTDS